MGCIGFGLNIISVLFLHGNPLYFTPVCHSGLANLCRQTMITTTEAVTITVMIMAMKVIHMGSMGNTSTNTLIPFIWWTRKYEFWSFFIAAR